MKIKAVNIDEIDFSAFGEHRRLTDCKDAFGTESYTCWVDFSKLLSGDWMIGYVKSGIFIGKTVKMEKHKRDQSLMICGDYPMVLPLIAAGYPQDLDEQPEGKVTAVILYPGDVALLNAGVWHDACYGIEHPVSYYFMSKVEDTDIVVKNLTDAVEIEL